MSNPHDPVPVKLILSMITPEDKLITEVLEKAKDMWGEIDYLSNRLPFNHTNYYKKEMGKNLFRRVSSFKRPIAIETLPSVKHLCKELEDSYLGSHNSRRINIDPGYMAPEKFVMATFKNFSHRIYLKDRVYADLTLIYRNKNFKSLEWTFPDYAEEELQSVLKRIRERYIAQLREKDGN